MKGKVIIHFVHGGVREMYVSEEQFENEIQPLMKGLFEEADWRTGCLLFDNALIPHREIKFIEFKEKPKEPKA